MRTERRRQLVATVGLALAAVLGVAFVAVAVSGLHGAELIRSAIELMAMLRNHVEVMLDGIAVLIRR